MKKADKTIVAEHPNATPQELLGYGLSQEAYIELITPKQQVPKIPIIGTPVLEPVVSTIPSNNGGVVRIKPARNGIAIGSGTLMARSRAMRMKNAHPNNYIIEG